MAGKPVPVETTVAVDTRCRRPRVITPPVGGPDSDRKKTGTPWAIERIIDPKEHGIDMNAIAADELKLLR